MIPQTFEQWMSCIIHDCKVPLTKDFADQRLSVYENSQHPETQKFIQLYGEEYLQNIIRWFRQV